MASYSGPCRFSVHGALRQKYFHIRKRYLVRNINTTNILYQCDTATGNLLQVVPKDELFDIFEKVHVEAGKHLWKDRFYVELKIYTPAFRGK